MLVRFKTSLGRLDAAAINDKFGSAIEFGRCEYGSEAEVKDQAAEFLVARGLAEPVAKINGQAKKPEIGPAK
mgnify:CR=1 FL=1